MTNDKFRGKYAPRLYLSSIIGHFSSIILELAAGHGAWELLSEREVPNIRHCDFASYLSCVLAAAIAARRSGILHVWTVSDGRAAEEAGESACLARGVP